MSTNPLLPLYGPIYGSLYFSVIMATGFYGVTCMQTFYYYVHYQNDHLRIKSFVAALWALNTIHEALTISGAYKYLMNGLQNAASILFGTPELVLLLTALVAVPTQGFFVHRLYVFSGKNIIVPLVWVILAIIQIVFSTMYVSKALYSANGVQVVTAVELSDNSFTNLGAVSLTVAAGVDVLIALFLTFLLVRKRATTPIASTANILQRLTVFAVNTGIWSAVFAVLTAVLMKVYRLNLLYAVFGIPLCSVYCNTLLANLNARSYVRGEATTHNVDGDLFSSSSSPMPDSAKADSMRHGEVQMVPFTRKGICKTTEVVRLPDDNWSTTLDNVSV